MSPPSDPRNTRRRPFIASLQKGSHFSGWPERTSKELERLRVTTPGTPATPPRWLRIAPVQYLKERWSDIVVLFPHGRKSQTPVRLVLTAEQPAGNHPDQLDDPAPSVDAPRQVNASPQPSPTLSHSHEDRRCHMRPRIIHNELFIRLQDQDPTIRAAAAYGLGKMKVRRAIKHLACALHDQTPEVRYHAAWALGAIRDPKAFIYLKAAKLDTDAGVRLAIDHALHRLTPPSTTSLINTLAHHPDSTTRAEAAKILGTLKEPQALETLVRALADPSVTVRWEAVQAIGRLRPHGDLSLLLAIMATLKDDDAFLRQQSVWALGCLATRGMTKKARDLIGTTLLRALRDPHPQVRGQVATTLGFMDVPHAVPQLMHCLRRDTDPAVRAEATKAVGRLLGWPGLSEPEWNTSYPELPINNDRSVQKETGSLSLVGGGKTGLA